MNKLDGKVAVIYNGIDAGKYCPPQDEAGTIRERVRGELGIPSAAPLVTLVGLRADGVIGGASVLHHSEPILLVGIPESALHEFADFYAGRPALQRVVVGRAGKRDVVSVDAGGPGRLVFSFIKALPPRDPQRLRRPREPRALQR